MTEFKVVKQITLENKKVILKRILETSDCGRCYDYDRIILPHLTDEELKQRYRKIKPIVIIDNNFYLIKRYNLNSIRNKTFIHSKYSDLREKVEHDNIKVSGEFACYHENFNPRTFNPTIADILEQFPDELLEVSNGFYIESPREDEQPEIINYFYHKSWKPPF